MSMIQFTAILESDDDWVQALFDIEYSVEPTEWEGNNIFFHGGFDISSITIAVPFRFHGLIYETGEFLPEVLEQYLVQGDLEQQALDFLNANVEIK